MSNELHNLTNEITQLKGVVEMLCGLVSTQQSTVESLSNELKEVKYLLSHNYSQNIEVNTQKLAKDVLEQILTPKITSKKLSKKEQFQLEVEQNLIAKNLELFKKHSKNK